MGRSKEMTPEEMDRLDAVRSLPAVTAGPTPELVALAELGQNVFGAPRAAVHVLDEDWLRIASQAGMMLSECPSDISICHRIIESRQLLVIPDLERHPELKLMPYVTGEPRLRFYAGAPVVLEPGLIVGTFCILDTQPRDPDTIDRESLMRFAVVAAGLLELQRANFRMTVSEKGLRDAAITDPLTGFYNRGALEQIVDRRLRNGSSPQGLFGSLYVDMDGFKSINDKFGHHVGDQVLQEAAQRIRAVVREHDVVVRMGGDEFAIFLFGLGGAGTLDMIAQRLLEEFRQPFVIDGQRLNARLSIGGGIAPPEQVDRANLLNAVDAALYQAKAAGRDRAVIRGQI